MNISELKIDEMSTEEKLRLVESIWDNIVSTSSDVVSPEWHFEILEKRANEDNFSDWDTVKERLNKIF